MKLTCVCLFCSVFLATQWWGKEATLTCSIKRKIHQPVETTFISIGNNPSKINLTRNFSSSTPFVRVGTRVGALINHASELKIKWIKRVWMGGYKCQLSVKISVICQLSVKFSSFCQLSVKWLLMINYETYLNIFDAKFGLKGTYNVN